MFRIPFLERRRALVGFTAAALVVLLTTTAVWAARNNSLWLSGGQNLGNTRNQTADTKLDKSNVSRLVVKWRLDTGGDVSATPAVDGSRVYVPDWGGHLLAVDEDTGAVVWKTNIADYTHVPGDHARSTPAIAGNSLIIGTQGPFGGGGWLLAVNKNTGALQWMTKLDDHPAAIITSSAVVYDGVAYVGVSSQEEALSAVVPGYPCCSFRGSIVAVDVATGQILWKTIMVPPGYSGGSVWGSTPSVDTKRGQLYVATGNNYSVPEAVRQCVEAAGGNPQAEQACVGPDDLIDAVVALDLKTGKVNWVTKALPYDNWNVNCIPGFGDPDKCPTPTGPDHDFGQAPALFTVRTADGKRKDMVGAGQKSGKYWSLDPDTGAVNWVTQAGPGGTAGGLQWGSAVDGTRVYTANANSNFVPWFLPDGSVTTAGVWSALDAATGQVVWQLTDPAGGSTSGPVSASNNVVFECSLAPSGPMYARDAATGSVLWRFDAGGSCLSGAAVAGGMVFWGSGYSNFGFGTPYSGSSLWAFGLPD